VNDHPRGLKERVETVAVHGNVSCDLRERIAGERDHEQKERCDSHQNCSRRADQSGVARRGLGDR
jgi:hypothetical protein